MMVKLFKSIVFLCASFSQTCIIICFSCIYDEWKLWCNLGGAVQTQISFGDPILSPLCRQSMCRLAMKLLHHWLVLPKMEDQVESLRKSSSHHQHLNCLNYIYILSSIKSQDHTHTHIYIYQYISWVVHRIYIRVVQALVCVCHCVLHMFWSGN